jgi:tetratricopeptide (TPR) repeat protein
MRCIWAACAALAASIAVTASGEQEATRIPSHIDELLRKGKFAEARAELQEYRRKVPDNPRAIFHLARIEPDADRALALFREVELFADSSLAAESMLARAELLAARGNMDEAEELYTAVADGYEGTTSYADALYRLGLVRLVAGQTEDAEVFFDRCLALEPDRKIRILALSGIMECRAASRNWEASIEAARNVLEADDENMLAPRVLDVIARAWRELGNDDNASHYTERLLKHFPDSYQAYAIRMRASSIGTDQRIPSATGESENDSTGTEQEFIGEDETAASSVRAITEETAKFTVQAAAFMDRDNALRQYLRLKEEGFESRLTMKTIADKHFYLIQIGLFMTREEAEEMADRVTEFTGVKAHIINLR